MPDFIPLSEVEAEERFIKLDPERQEQVRANWRNKYEKPTYPSLEEVRSEDRYKKSSPEKQAEVDSNWQKGKKASYTPSGSLIEGYDISGGLEDIGRAGKGLLNETISSVASAFAGKNPRDTYPIIKSVLSRQEERRKEAAQAEAYRNEDPEDKVFPAIPGLLPEGIKRKDIQALERNLGSTIAAMVMAQPVSAIGTAAGASVGGAIGSIFPGAGTSAGAAIGGTIGRIGSQAVASFASGYLMDRSAITEQLLQAKEEVDDRKMTIEESDAYIAENEANLNDHAFWEGATETAQTPANMALMKAMGTSFAGKFGVKVGAALFAKFMATHAIEAGGETITQQKQQQAESRMGLTPEPERPDTLAGYKTSYDEVAAATLLTSGAVGAAGAAAGTAKKAVTGSPSTPTEDPTETLTPDDLTTLTKSNEYTKAELTDYQAMLDAAPTDAIRAGIRTSAMGQAMELSRKTLLPTKTEGPIAPAPTPEEEAEIEAKMARTEAEEAEVAARDAGVLAEDFEEIDTPIEVTEADIIEEPVVEEPVVEPLVEDTVAPNVTRGNSLDVEAFEEPVVEEPVVEEPVVEEPVVEEPVVEEPVIKTSKASTELDLVQGAIDRGLSDIEARLDEGKTRRAAKVQRDIPKQEIKFVRDAHKVPMEERSDDSLNFELSLLNKQYVHDGLNDSTEVEGSILDEPSNKAQLNAGLRMAQVIEELKTRKVEFKVDPAVYDMDFHKSMLRGATQASDPIQPTAPTNKEAFDKVEARSYALLKNLRSIQQPDTSDKSKASQLIFVGGKVDLKKLVARINKIPLEMRTENMLETQIRVGELFPNSKFKDAPHLTAGLKVIQRYHAVKGHKSEKVKVSPREKVEKKQVVKKPKSEKPLETKTEKQVAEKPKTKAPVKKIPTIKEQNLRKAKARVKRLELAEKRLNAIDPKTKVKVGSKKKISNNKTSLAVARSVLKGLNKTKSKTTETKSKEKTSTSIQPKKESKLDVAKSTKKEATKKPTKVVEVAKETYETFKPSKPVNQESYRSAEPIEYVKSIEELETSDPNGYSKSQYDELVSETPKNKKDAQKRLEELKQELLEALKYYDTLGYSANDPEDAVDIYPTAMRIIALRLYIDQQVKSESTKPKRTKVITLKRLNELRTALALSATTKEENAVVSDLSPKEVQQVLNKIDNLVKKRGDYDVLKAKIVEVHNLNEFNQPKGSISDVTGPTLSVEEVQKEVADTFSKSGIINVVPSLTPELKKLVGEEKAQALLDSNGKLAGVYYKGKITLAADSITDPSEIYPLVVHEGGHWLRDQDKSFQKTYSEFLSRMNEMGSGKGSLPEQRAIQSAVRKAMRQGDLSEDTIQEESMMYFLQNEANTELPFYKKVVSFMKQMLFKHFKISASSLKLSGYDMAQILAHDIQVKLAAKEDMIASLTGAMDAKMGGANEDIRFSFKGEKARMYGDEANQRAQAGLLDLQGLSQEEIRKETGWFKTKGYWVKELTDEDAELTDEFEHYNTQGEKDFSRLGDLIHHPELFKAYPFLESMPVNIRPRTPEFDSDGAYYPSFKLIQIAQDIVDPLGTIIHEIQHAIQHEEGFPSGGNTADNKRNSRRAPIEVITKLNDDKRRDTEKRIHDLNSAIAQLDKQKTILENFSISEMGDYNNFIDSHSSDNTYSQNDKIENSFIDWLETKGLPFIDINSGYFGSKIQATRKQKAQLLEDRGEAVSISQSLDRVGETAERENAANYSAFELYQNLHGEIMARDASDRAGINETERDDIPPAIVAQEDTASLAFNNDDGPPSNSQSKKPEFNYTAEEMINRALGNDENMTDQEFHRALIKDAFTKTAKHSKNPVVKKIANDFTQYDIEFKRDENTQTTSGFDRVFSSPEYYTGIASPPGASSKKDSAAGRVVNHALYEDELKFKIQNKIVGEGSSSFASFAQDLTKTNPKAIEEVSEYIDYVDKTGKGYYIKFNDGLWEVYSPDNVMQENWDERQHASDFLIEDEQIWVQEDHPGTKKLSKDARLYLEAYRQLMNRSLVAQNADLQRQIDTAEAAGLEESTDGEGGKKLADIIRESGDLEGTYRPRVRPKSKYYAKLIKAGHPDEVMTFDDFIPRNTLRGPLNNRVRNLINTKRKTGRQLSKLKADGYTVIELGPTKAPADELFDPTGITLALDNLLDQATESVDDGEYKAQLLQLNNLILQNIGNIYKEKGNLSNRRKRSKTFTTGFEPDVTKAAISHAQQVSAGIAKRATAQNMVNAFTGHDLSFQDYMKDNPDGDFTSYRVALRKRKISSTHQKSLFKDMKTYMNYVLKPVSPAGKAVGYLKALAVLKYLGFRVSSALVNMTNMTMGVPATLMAHTGINSVKALGHVSSAAGKYASYRSNKLALRGVAPGVLKEAQYQIEKLSKGIVKGLSSPVTLTEAEEEIFESIHHKGWDSPHFNIEATRAIQDNISKWFNTLMETSMYMFGATEKANRAMTIFAAYQAHKANPVNKGLTQEDLLQLAKHTSDRAHGIYGKGAKPWLVQKYHALDLMYTFMKFQHNYLLNSLEMGMKYKNWKASTLAMSAPVVVAGLGAGFGVKAVMALASSLLPMFGLDGDDPEEAIYSWAEENLGKFAEKTARHGLAGSTLGLNLKGSLAFNSPIGTGKLSDLGGAPLSTVADEIAAIRHFGYGEISKGLEKALPSGMGGSLAKAYRLNKKGYTTTTASPKFFGSEQVRATPLETIALMLTLNPQRLASIQEELWHERLTKEDFTTDRGKIMRRYKNYFATPIKDRNPKTFIKINGMVEDYNERVRISDPKYNQSYLTWPKIYKTLRQSMKPSKQERNREIN